MKFEMIMETKNYFVLIVFFLFISSCDNGGEKSLAVKAETSPSLEIDSIVYPIADSFDFPVGKPNAKAYYNARGFMEEQHLGDDWNAGTGGNSDLGDPIYAIAAGIVTTAANFGGGWGNVIMIEHHVPNENNVESLYAHCLENMVKKGDKVEKGQQIATIGNADGAYLAHLHFEIRNIVGMPIGSGYSLDTTGYLNPTKYINAHR